MNPVEWLLYAAAWDIVWKREVLGADIFYAAGEVCDTAEEGL